MKLSTGLASLIVVILMHGRFAAAQTAAPLGAPSFTHVIQPGAQLRELGRNVLENVQLSGQGGNPCKQESFYTAPYFEGKFMYLRGEEYLYCIGGK